MLFWGRCGRGRQWYDRLHRVPGCYAGSVHLRDLYTDPDLHDCHSTKRLPCGYDKPNRIGKTSAFAMPGSATCRRMFATMRSALTLRVPRASLSQLWPLSVGIHLFPFTEVFLTKTEMAKSRWRQITSYASHFYPWPVLKGCRIETEVFGTRGFLMAPRLRFAQARSLRPSSTTVAWTRRSP